MHTNRTKVHEGGEGNDPEVLGVDYVAAIELGGGGDVRQLGKVMWRQTES